MKRYSDELVKKLGEEKEIIQSYGTEVIFTESINLKKWWLYPFALLYLKLQQKRYIADLKRKCEQE